MTKELQDLVWSILPKEFKEEVKETYREYTEKIATKSEPEYRIVGYIAAQTELELLFGLHNLISDAEGEEMLTISRTKIEALHSEIHKAIMDAHDADDWQDAAHYILDILPRSFNALFGSKCLPDEKEFAENANCKEPKPAEPSETLCMDSEGFYRKGTDEHDNKVKIRIPSGETEPYTEPKEDHIGENHEMIKDFDTILKDGFRNERRLNIAVMIVQGVLSNPNIIRSCSDFEDSDEYIVKTALMYTDTLMDECEKGGNNE